MPDEPPTNGDEPLRASASSDGEPADDAESVFETAQAWLAEGRRLVWATVVSTFRSSPRPLGSQMVIADDGRFAGSVSGGCVEAAVIAAAAQLFAGQPSRTVRYGVSSEQAWDVGLPCGGKLEVFMGEVPPNLLAHVVEGRRRRQSVGWVTDLSSGAQSLSVGALQPEPALSEVLTAALGGEQSQLIEAADRRVFVHVVPAPPRLVVVGAVHLTQALAELAKSCGFEVIVVDPRTAFATRARFPSARLCHDWPDEALDALPLDRRTAVVVLSHDAKLDEPALMSALRSESFYIGALGSRRTQEARRQRLAEAGFGDADLARIHGPVGLAIGAVTAPEMAVAIMAEIVQARRRGTSQPY